MKKFEKWILIIVAATTIIGAVGAVFTDGTKASEPTAEEIAEAKADSIKQQKAGAYLAAKQVVEKSLKAPSTAKFAQYGYGEDPAMVNMYEDGTCRVELWVDAQNSYGAMIRNKYQVYLNIQGGKWDIINISKIN